LYTTDYAVVADVDPRIGEHLLEVLGDRGIAAYLKPTADENPVTRATALPSPPMDRLYVDRSAVTVARRLLAEATSGANDASDVIGVTSIDQTPAPESESSSSTLTAPARGRDDFEAAWASIVAGYNVTAAPERSRALGDGTEAIPMPPSPPPSQTPEPDSADPPDRSTIIKPAKPFLNDERGSLLDSLDSFGADLPDDEEEDFKPPAPPPLPRIGPAAITGLLAIVIGMVAIVYPDLLVALPTSDAQVFGGTCVLAGAVLLVSRLRSGSDDDGDDPDDGAVV
jgi:hypothetical protein